MEDARMTMATAIDHLWRFAFFTRDNPFASIRAGEQLPRIQRDTLLALLRGDVAVDEWLRSEAGEALLRPCSSRMPPAGSSVDGGPERGCYERARVPSEPPIFWWLVSMLWCISVGRSLDPTLDDGVKGNRLHPNFIEDPSTSGVMFRDPHGAYRSWKRHIALASRETPGQVMAANTVDVASFYYSVKTGPGEIVSSYMEAAGIEATTKGLANSGF